MKRYFCHSMWLALVCATLVGCNRALPQVQMIATSTPGTQSVIIPAPTATATPAPPALPWKAAAVIPWADWVFANSDGNIGYNCFFDSTTLITTVDVTHDRGVHYAPVVVPAVKGGDECIISVDDNNAAIAVVKISGSFPVTAFATSERTFSPAISRSAPGPQEISDFLTVDGGQHWRLIPNNITIDLFTSVGGRIYAFIGTNPRWAGEPFLRDPHFVMSDDGMQSWRELPTPVAHSATDVIYTNLPSANDGATFPHITQYGQLPRLFVDPYSGDLLYADNSTKDESVLMRRSSDGGYTWAAMASPVAIQQSIFSIPGAQHPWEICFSHDTAIWCSNDTGRSWQQRKLTDHLDFNEAHSNFAFFMGIASNGDLLADFSNQTYRLLPHATHWQLLTSPPGNIVGIFGPASANILWAVIPSSEPPLGDMWYSVAYP